MLLELRIRNIEMILMGIKNNAKHTAGCRAQGKSFPEHRIFLHSLSGDLHKEGPESLKG